MSEVPERVAILVTEVDDVGNRYRDSINHHNRLTSSDGKKFLLVQGAKLPDTLAVVCLRNTFQHPPWWTAIEDNGITFSYDGTNEGIYLWEIESE